MTRLSEGSIDVTIPAVERTDEIGAMAQTVEVFKKGLIRARDLTEAQTHEVEAKERKQRQLDAFIQEFELTVVSVLDGLAAADHAMRGNSRRMSTNAAQTREQVTTVAAASEEAMNNVQTVAAAAEQLSISIQEIARQAAHASSMASRAVRETAVTTDAMRVLEEKVGGIGVVVQLDRRYRQPDQPAGAQRHDRGGTGRRGRQRLRHRGVRGQGPGQPDRPRHRGDHPADR